MFLAAYTIAADKTLNVADLLDFEKVTGAQVSPDGSQVLYTRRWVDQSVDRWASAIWVMDADGHSIAFVAVAPEKMLGKFSLLLPPC